MPKNNTDANINLKAQNENAYETIYRDCKDCGQRFPIYAGEQQYAERNSDTYVLPLRCKKCRTARKNFMEIVCKCCGRTFRFTANEQKFYNDHNLQTPKKCPECRKNKSGGKQGGQIKTEEDKSE